MIRGTTPTLTFTIPSSVDMDDISNVHIILKTPTRKVIKDLGEVELDKTNHLMKLYLTQKETLAFSVGECIIQVRVLLENGTALACRPIKVCIEPILEDEVIEDYESTQNE